MRELFLEHQDTHILDDYGSEIFAEVFRSKVWGLWSFWRSTPRLTHWEARGSRVVPHRGKPSWRSQFPEVKLRGLRSHVLGLGCPASRTLAVGCSSTSHEGCWINLKAWEKLRTKPYHCQLLIYHQMLWQISTAMKEGNKKIWRKTSGWRECLPQTLHTSLTVLLRIWLPSPHVFTLMA